MTLFAILRCRLLLAMIDGREQAAYNWARLLAHAVHEHDDVGRAVAPKQVNLPTRPAGPWDENRSLS